eukprot:TRINITY_DN18949_c0_g1_i1.p1 TRINITY_DN18949_c0_g1~~TRINITY_DN18949_c0_g1_i1.p1  ORF type:complete len:451 (-),score=142.75 TRINITY_DN18949_c0_g1_i1:62-1225(-)
MEENADLIPKIAKNGISIDGSSIGVVDVNQSDIRLIPDWDTYCNYKSGGEVIDRVLCAIQYKGQRHPACLRSLMKSTIERCNKMGFDVHMFGEVEWFFVNNDGTPHDHAGYCSLPPADKAQHIRHEIADALENSGCRVKRIHHENGPGQNEVELKLMPAMKNADDLVTSMEIIRAAASSNGITADFLPKPFDGEAGSGFHQHFALYDAKTGKNVFGTEWQGGERPKQLITPLGLSFIAGLMAHAEEITSVFARHEQSFKRLEPGHEAPAVVCWGTSNRTALIRIPDPSESQDTRIEYRGGDASGATHLMCAVLLAAGLDGVERNLECAPEVLVNADLLGPEALTKMGLRRIPSTLADTRKVLEGSAWLRQVLGEPVVKYLIEGKRKH